MARVEAGYFDWQESVDSSGNYLSAEIPYFVFDATSEGDALEAVRSSISEKYEGLYLDEVAIDERLNDSTYKVLARYREDETKRQAEGDTDTGNANPTVTFDTTGGTRHISRSKLTVSKTPESAPDYGGAIEVDGEGNVNGVDVTMPVMTFSETHYFALSKVSTSYQKQLFTLTGKVNNSSFRGFSAGEVLFLGASGQKTGTGDEALWEITFKFAVSPNASNVKVSDDITVSQKMGWDYLWVRFGEKAVSGLLVKTPVAAYVERVYEAADFSGLKLEAAITAS